MNKVNKNPTTKAGFYAPAVGQDVDILKQTNQQNATTATNYPAPGCGRHQSLHKFPECPCHKALMEQDSELLDCQSWAGVHVALIKSSDSGGVCGGTQRRSVQQLTALPGIALILCSGRGEAVKMIEHPHCVGPLAYHISFHGYNHPMAWGLLFPFYRWGNWGSKKQWFRVIHPVRSWQSQA